MENIWTGFLKQQPEPHIEQASILWKGEEEEGREEGRREGGGQEDAKGGFQRTTGKVISLLLTLRTRKKGGRWGGKSAGMS